MSGERDGERSLALRNVMAYIVLFVLWMFVIRLISDEWNFTLSSAFAGVVVMFANFMIVKESK